MSKPPAAQVKKPTEEVTLPVALTALELSALSFVVMVCTSAVEKAVVNAAERGYKKVRDAAKKHPRLPPTAR